MAKKIVRFVETAKADGVCYYRGSIVEMSNTLAMSLRGQVVAYKAEKGEDFIKHQKPSKEKLIRNED